MSEENKGKLEDHIKTNYKNLIEKDDEIVNMINIGNYEYDRLIKYIISLKWIYV